MKDSRGYLERMEKSMREKLFFLEHIDLDNKIIIDFGAANGALAKEIMNTNPINMTYFCVESNEEFFKECEILKVLGVHIVHDLTEVEMWLKNNKDNREVVLICSSVMHELTQKMQRNVVRFSREYCDYMIVRDMFYEYNSIPDEREKDILEKIICLAPRPDLMQQFFYLRGISKKTMAEYLLKYSYVENWNTEVNEKYLDVDWIIIKYFETEEVKPEIVYERYYTNNFIAGRVYNTFGINMNWCTHGQLILKMKRNEVKDYEEATTTKNRTTISFLR